MNIELPTADVSQTRLTRHATFGNHIVFEKYRIEVELPTADVSQTRVTRHGSFGNHILFWKIPYQH
jgi:hypothetical protein